MPSIAITGLSGEVGTQLLEQMKNLPATVIDLFHTNPRPTSNQIRSVPLNLEEVASIIPTLEKVRPNVIIHLAGQTHIDRCEADKPNGQAGKVWQINVAATAKIAQYCARNNAYLIYLSTECVFNGEQQSYSESAPTQPINWYGETKAAAEHAIIDSGCNFAIARAVIAYSPQANKTLWQHIESGLKKGQTLKMANDHWMTPTFMADIAQTLDQLLITKLSGIFHVSPNAPLTPFEFAVKLAKKMGYSSDRVMATPLEEIMGPERAQLRLKHACLNSKETENKLGIRFRSIEEI